MLTLLVDRDAEARVAAEPSAACADGIYDEEDRHCQRDGSHQAGTEGAQPDASVQQQDPRCREDDRGQIDVARHAHMAKLARVGGDRAGGDRVA